MDSTIEYFNALCRISSALGSTTRYEELLDLVVENAVEAMNGKGATLFLANEENDYFDSVAETGLSDNYKHINPIRAKEIIDTVVKEGGCLAVKDATTDPRIPNHDAKKAEGIASILVVPVIVKNKTIGVLTLYTSEQRNFSDNEIALLKALAQQGGLAIERSRLLKRTLNYAWLFKDISESINSSLDVKKIFEILTFDVCKALNLKGALIRLKDEETEELRLVASHGLSEGFLNKGPVYYEKGFKKIIHGESIYVENITDSKLIQYPQAAIKEGIASIFSVPVKTGDTIIGIMNFYSAGDVKFTKAFTQIAEALAIQGGIAIQNASAYLKLNETKESLEQDIWGFRSWF